MPALGERFRAAREARGLTLSDVAEQIRIRSVYLAAIEEENWPAIGAPVYVRGFLRTYARFLGLDAEEAVGAFNEQAAGATAEAPPEAEAVAARPSEPRRLLPFIWVASVVAVLLIAYVAFNAFSPREPALQSAPTVALPSASASAGALPPDETAATASPQTSASPDALVSPSATIASQANSLSVQLSAPSWLRVVIDGKIVSEGTFPAGTSKTFRGKRAVLLIGNAGGVRVFVDGKPIAPLGKSGAVVERAFVL
jgi:cytoskeletal protein RodZ